MNCCRAYFPLLFLLVLPAALRAQEGQWVAITRLGDTVRNVHFLESNSGADTLYGFVRGEIAPLSETASVVSAIVSPRWLALRDVASLYHERSSSFWIGAAAGGGLGVGGDIALHARNNEAPLVPFVTTLGAVAGGLVGTLLSIDESYILAYLPLDEARLIVDARLPHARRDPSASRRAETMIVTPASASHLVSRESLWLGLGAFGGGVRQGKAVRVAAFGGLNFRRDKHIVGLHYLNTVRVDQLYEDIALHYGRSFTMLGGEGYLSVGPGYAWGGEATTRTDTAQAITRYSTVSISAIFQQQWLVARWFSVGAGMFIGTTDKYPFAGGTLMVSFGDLD